MKTALHGDLTSLKKEVRASQPLEGTRLRELAEAVAAREVMGAKGERGARRLGFARACADDLGHVLQRRSKGKDLVAASAAMLLFEAKKISSSDAVKHVDSSEGAWRAVGARALTSRAQGPQRRALLRDPDDRVRMAACRAASASRDPADLEELLEVARLDPVPEVRGLAISAVGSIGGGRAVDALNDLWVSSEHRVEIIEAWWRPAARRSGGQERVRRIAESSLSREAIHAAARLFGVEEDGLGEAVLERALREGTTFERRLAIRLIPPGVRVLNEALSEASKAADRDVQVLALARLSEAPGGRQARNKLKKLSAGSDQVAVQARAALAALGDPSVIGLLEKQLDDTSPERRRLAALALLRATAGSKAALALADDDPDVRLRTACTVLSRGKSEMNAFKR